MRVSTKANTPGLSCSTKSVAADDLTKIEIELMNASADKAAAASSTLRTATVGGGACALVSPF